MNPKYSWKSRTRFFKVGGSMYNPIYKKPPKQLESSVINDRSSVKSAFKKMHFLLTCNILDKVEEKLLDKLSGRTNN